MSDPESSSVKFVLKRLHEVAGWDEAIVYESPSNKTAVVFHNGYRLGVTVAEAVITDAVAAGRRAIDCLVESVVNMAMGTPEAKTLVRPGLDPGDVRQTIYQKDWEPMDRETQDSMLMDVTGSIMVVRDSNIESSKPESVGDPIEPEPATPPPPVVDPAAEARPACEPPGLHHVVHSVPVDPKARVVGHSRKALTDLDDSEVAYACRKYMADCIVLMKGRPAFNGSIGYVREALKVCPSV